MESVKLAETLRALGDATNPNAYEPWAKRLRPLLPDAPLPRDFLEKIIEPMPMIYKATVLDHLARLGRAEVAPLAAELSAKAEGFPKMILAGVLIECADGLGYDVLEELYHRSVKNPGDKKGSVSPELIFDSLVELGEEDRRALTLRMRLVAWAKENR
jgi:hypothetical protein